MWHTLIERAKGEVIRHAGWMLFGQVLMSLSAFLVTYALANAVSKEIAGSYRFVVTTYTVIASFAFYGIGTTLTKAVAQGKSGIIRRMYRLKFWAGCVAALVLVLFALYTYAHDNNGAVLFSLIVAALVLPLTEMFSLYNFALQGASLFRDSSLYLGVGRLLTNILVAGTAYLMPQLIPIASVYFLITLIYAYVAHKRSAHLVPQDGEDDSSALQYATHVSIAGALGGFITQMHVFVLYGFFGPAALATYWIAGIIPQEIGRMVSIVASVLFPRLASSDRDTAYTYIRKWWLLACGALALAGVVYALLAPAIFHLFFPLYASSVALSIFLLVAFAFVPDIIVWQLLVARGHIGGLYIVNIIDPLLLLVLYIICVPMFGVMGVAYANIIQNIITNIAGALFVFRNPLMVRLLER